MLVQTIKEAFGIVTTADGKRRITSAVGFHSGEHPGPGGVRCVQMHGNSFSASSRAENKAISQIIAEQARASAKARSREQLRVVADEATNALSIRTRAHRQQQNELDIEILGWSARRSAPQSARQSAPPTARVPSGPELSTEILQRVSPAEYAELLESRIRDAMGDEYCTDGAASEAAKQRMMIEIETHRRDILCIGQSCSALPTTALLPRVGSGAGTVYLPVVHASVPQLGLYIGCDDEQPSESQTESLL